MPSTFAVAVVAAKLSPWNLDDFNGALELSSASTIQNPHYAFMFKFK
jgi:hypothetical protein